jgi:hypothetical protein
MSKEINDDNPFIKFLPPIMTEVPFFKKIAQIPMFDKNASLLDRMEQIGKIRNSLFIPLTHHYYAYLKLFTVLKESYRVRTPAETIRMLYEIKNWNDHPHQPPTIKRQSVQGFSLLGVSGMGKTMTIEKILELIPQLVVYKDLGIKQVTYLKIDCTTKGSTKQICHSFLSELDRVAGTNYFEKYERNTEERLVIQLANKAVLHRLGILVIDEIHNLVPANEDVQKRIMNSFKELNNRIGIPIIYVGTDQAVPILYGDFQTASRAQGVGMPILDRFKEEDPEWSYFIKQLWEQQVLRSPGKLTKELEMAYYHESQGIIRILIQVHCLAQEIALLNKSETITVKYIENTRQHLSGTKIAIDGLRNKDFSVLKRFNDVQMTQSYMYNLDGQEKWNISLKVQKGLQEHASKAWPKVKPVQVRECIEIVLRNFPTCSFDDKCKKLDEGIENLVAHLKTDSKRKQEDSKGDLIDICRNANSDLDRYNLLVESGVISDLREIFE